MCHVRVCFVYLRPHTPYRRNILSLSPLPRWLTPVSHLVAFGEGRRAIAARLSAHRGHAVSCRAREMESGEDD